MYLVYKFSTVRICTVRSVINKKSFHQPIQGMKGKGIPDLLYCTRLKKEKLIHV